MRILGPVKPTPEQLPILSDSGPGVRLIRGAAGSGKTTTGLLRLKQLCRSRLARRARLGIDDPVRVLVLTYNRTLGGYISELARNEVSLGPGLILEVSTFARWARSYVPDARMLDHPVRANILRSEIRSLTTDAQLTDFYIDEVDYALSRFLPTDLQTYLTVRRDGRGASPRMEHARREQLLNEVIEPYRVEKSRRNAMDWNDLALAAAQEPGTAYDVVIVDEAQDFSANEVRCVLAHLANESSTTFILDAMQRIYPRSFTWAEVGIALRPNQIYSLKSNHRNTAQIAAFARPLVEGLPAEEFGDLPDFTACQKNGPKPVVISGKYADQIRYMVNEIIASVDLTTDSVAVLQPRGGGWLDYVRDDLRARGIPFCELTKNSNWPTGPEAIGLSTIPSAKGLEFDHVLLPGLNQQVTPHGDGEGDASLDRLRRLFAMGVGRARKSVMVGYKAGEESSLIALLDPSTYDAVAV